MRHVDGSYDGIFNIGNIHYSMGLLDHDTLISINTCMFVFLNIKICKTYEPVQDVKCCT